MTISSPRRDFIWPLPVQHFKPRQRSLMRFRSKWKDWKRPILLLTQRLKHKSKNVNTALSAKLNIQKRVWTAANFAVLSKVDAQKEELLSVNSTLRAQIDSQKREWSFANSALTAVVEGHKREWRAADTELGSNVELQAKEVPFVWKLTGFNEVLRLANIRRE